MDKQISIMPCLDMQNGRVVKGVHFVDIRDAGDPVECAKAYCDAGADELALLDITATIENRPTMLEVVKNVKPSETDRIAAISGATITSNAVKDIVKQGIEYVRAYRQAHPKRDH